MPTVGKDPVRPSACRIPVRARLDRVAAVGHNRPNSTRVESPVRGVRNFSGIGYRGKLSGFLMPPTPIRARDPQGFLGRTSMGHSGLGACLGHGAGAERFPTFVRAPKRDQPHPRSPIASGKAAEAQVSSPSSPRQ